MSRSLQRPLPPMELRNVSPEKPLRTNPSQSPETVAEQADSAAARIFDAAMNEAGLSNKAAALCVGVSDSMVSRWRSTAHREQPSYAQVLMLPAKFQEARRRAESQVFGLGQKALLRLIEAVGDVAQAV